MTITIIYVDFNSGKYLTTYSEFPQKGTWYFLTILYGQWDVNGEDLSDRTIANI